MIFHLSAFVLAAVIVGHHPINGLNLLALIVLAAMFWTRRQLTNAPVGCDRCNGVNPCFEPSCARGPVRERLP